MSNNQYQLTLTEDERRLVIDGLNNLVQHTQSQIADSDAKALTKGLAKDLVILIDLVERVGTTKPMSYMDLHANPLR